MNKKQPSIKHILRHTENATANTAKPCYTGPSVNWNSLTTRKTMNKKQPSIKHILSNTENATANTVKPCYTGPSVNWNSLTTRKTTIYQTYTEQH